MTQEDGEARLSPETGEENSGKGVSEEEFSSLLQGIDAMAPLMKGVLRMNGSHAKGEHGGRGGTEEYARREALLCALKPYLSPERCAAVDYLLRLWRVGDAIRALR